jgi:hypothetical protein
MTPEGYIHGRFMKMGKESAFTPELAEKIRSGVPVITHTHSEKDLDGNEAKGIFHLKKSDKDNYFLNKVDMEVKKAGKNEIFRESHNLSEIKKNLSKDDAEAKKFHLKFSFKKAFNYLLGRAVRNEYQNANGESRKDWEQMDFKNNLGGGNYGKRVFNENYGFDLEKVMSHYSMKDMANPAYKASLIQSQERGNLQKTPFVGNDGKETQLFVTPNILLGTMNVFRLNETTNKKELVPLAELEKNGWVTKEFAQTIKERVAEITKKNSLTQKPTATESVTKTAIDKPAKQKVNSKKNKEHQADGSEVKVRKPKKNKQNIS